MRRVGTPRRPSRFAPAVRPWKLLLAVGLAALVTGQAVVTNLPIGPTGTESSSAHALDLPGGTAEDEGGLGLSGVPPGSPLEAILDELGDLLGDGSHPQPATSLTELMGRLGRGEPPLPIPAAPEGPEPLMTAMARYGEALGVTMPPPEALRTSLASLALAPEAENALSQLILAYGQAVRLQREATERLTEQERMFIAADPETVRDWLAADPARTSEDYLSAAEAMVQEKVDLGKTLQASDLLARTIDVVRGPLALPPSLPSLDAQPALAVDAAGPDADALEGWELVKAVLGSSPEDANQPATTSLSQALHHLLAAYGFPDENVPLGGAPPLPPSLETAVARIVDAHAEGIEQGDARKHAQMVTRAAQDAEPTLRAWATLLESPGDAVRSVDAVRVLGQILAPVARPGGVALSLLDVGDAPALRPALPLAELLVKAGLPPTKAQAAAASLPPQLSAALAQLLEAHFAVEAARDALFRPLGATDRAALAHTLLAADLLDEPEWTAPEARFMDAWGQAAKKLGSDAQSRLQEAQAAAVARTELARAILLSAIPPVNAQSVPAPIHNLVAGLLDDECPTDSGFSECVHDVWFQTDAGPGILITGFHSTVIDKRFAGGNPQIIIDLGGDDTYYVAAGAVRGGLGVPVPTKDDNEDGIGSFNSLGDAYHEVVRAIIVPPYEQDQQRFFDNATSGKMVSIALDMAGNDRYNSPFRWAQGAAEGLGAVGILWDSSGNDDYNQTGDASTLENYGHGAANLGGLGLLIDEEGSDVYRAPRALAQGVGLTPFYQPSRQQPIIVGAFAGTGALLDLGPGDDNFTAHRGQGHSQGPATAGLLFDEQGVSNYRTVVRSDAFQGGRPLGLDVEPVVRDVLSGVNPPFPRQKPSGFAMLVDLGGRDDVYSNRELGADTTVIHHESTKAERRDDALWLNLTTGLALGLDSTLGDEDDDKFPNLIELLAGSSPHNATETPVEVIKNLDPAEVIGDVLDAVGEQIGDPQSDEDGDMFPDAVEEFFGSDPKDPESVPGDNLDSTILDLPVLCPPIPGPPQDGGCGGNTVGGPNGNLTCSRKAQRYCVSLLTVGGVGTTRHDWPAIVSIDLGGDDLYRHEVAGSGAFRMGSVDVMGGSISLDLSGDDRYETANLSRTQAYAETGASLLFDLDGDDFYSAHDDSQGSSLSRAVEAAQLGLAVKSTGHAAVALLADFEGNDEYEAGARSQGANHELTAPSFTGAGEFFTAGSHGGLGLGALLDLDGDDSYSFATQGLSTGNGGQALMLDVAGQDTYVSQREVVDVDQLSRKAPLNVFHAQGSVRVQLPPAPSAGVDLGAVGHHVAPVFGFFIDAGPEKDSYYAVDLDGNTRDVTWLKDAAGLRPNPVSRAAVSGTAGATQDIRVPAFALFADDAQYVMRDDDRDGAIGLAELLAGKDPLNRDDHPGTLFELETADVLESGEPILDVQPGGNVVYEALALARVHVPGLIIGGRGPTLYDRYEPFIVDLGGDDQYTAPFLGGMSPTLLGTFRPVDVPTATADVALLLDVGADGDDDVDVYRPAACRVANETAGNIYTGHGDLRSQKGANNLATGPVVALTHCPSLGGALLGIAILADDGGNNQFESSLEVTLEGRPPFGGESEIDAMAWGLTQGAGMLGGVGILATWDAANTFHSDVRVLTSEFDTDDTPTATANGLSQGAAWAGVGILAAFGGGDDEFVAETLAATPHSHGVGIARDLSQGAAMQGLGMLLDGGGDNRYTALNGFSQGYAAKRPYQAPTAVAFAREDTNRFATGILWSGNGDDEYVGGDRSQGAGADATTPKKLPEDGAFGATVHSNVTGFLLDGGGNDVYRIPPSTGSVIAGRHQCPLPVAAPACALSQGAGMDRGRGVLVDLAGDDHYEAPARTHVQAAAIGGVGILYDAAGHDEYRAYAKSQAYAIDHPSVESGFSLLLDALGWDHYEAVNHSQGATEWINPALLVNKPLLAFFGDGAGEDRYDYGGTKIGVPAAGPANKNNWTWRSPPPVRPAPPGSLLPIGVGSGVGVDDGRIESVLAAYAAQEKSINEKAGTDAHPLGTVSLTASDAAGAPLGEDAGGTIHFHPVVTVNGPQTVDRVTLLANGVALGHATLVGTTLVAGGASHRYRFEWDTLAGTQGVQAVGVPDGTYHVVASAFIQEGPSEVGRAPADRPSPRSAESPKLAVNIDNQPLLRTTLIPDATTPGMDAISPDLDKFAQLRVEVGRDVKFPEGISSGEPPGGFLKIEILPKDSDAGCVLLDEYKTNKTHPIPIDGICDDDALEEGRYLIRSTLTEEDGDSVTTQLQLLIDSTGPVSRIETDSPANSTLKSGLSDLIVTWAHDDDAKEVGDVVGVDRVHLLRLDAAGAVVAQYSDFSPTQTSFSLPGVTSGQFVRLVTIAQDALGNLEAPCLPDEPAPCYRAKAGDVVDVLIDFIPPRIETVTPSTDYVQPGRDVTFTVDVKDTHTGVDNVTIRFDNNVVAPMTDQGSGTWTYSDWGKRNLGRSAKEELYAYEVVARDAAGNEETVSLTGYMDNMPPRIEVDDTQYDDGDRYYPIGRPGTTAVVRVHLKELKMGRLTADVGALTPGATVACQSGADPSDLTLWTCEASVPESAVGKFSVPLTAVDAAGNQNTTAVAHLEVVNQPPLIEDVQVVERRHDALVVRWRTSEPADSTVLYGKTLELGRSTGTDHTFVTVHEITLRDLAPSTSYFFQVASKSRAGLVNEDVALQSAKTLSAYTLTFPPFSSSAWSGQQNITLAVDLLSGTDPVVLKFSLQDAQRRSSPVPLTSLVQGEGLGTVTVRTTDFGDGEYRIVVEGERAGDFQTVESPLIRIDNTAPVLLPVRPAPGATTNESRPLFEVGVLDPLSKVPARLDRLVVFVDGAPQTLRDVLYEGKPDGSERRLRFRLTPDLPTGVHLVRIQIADDAGNLGEATWSFRVDRDAPRLRDSSVAYLPGPAAARPGGKLRLALNATDDSEIASVEVDLTALGGTRVNLFSLGRGAWAATLDVPVGATSGTFRLPLVAKDSFGNGGPLGDVTVRVDSRLPQLTALDYVAEGWTGLAVRYTTDEPTGARLSAAGAPEVSSDVLETTKRIVLEGLRPGRVYSVTLRAWDAAGNELSLTWDAATTPDGAPPSPPGLRPPVSPEEGVVRLSWSAAQDNSGIHSYEIQRLVGGVPQTIATVPGNVTEYEDRTAVPGEDASYRVIAVDLADFRSAPAVGTVRVLALPHLEEATLTPESGPSDQPFLFRVKYRHPSGVLPDRVEARYAGSSYVLSLVGGPAACAEGCIFEGQYRLPPSGASADPGPIVFRAEAQGRSTELALAGLPLVSTGEGEAGVLLSHKGGGSSPSGAPWLALLVVAGLARWVWRRRQA